MSEPTLPKHWRLLYDNKYLGHWNLIDPKTGKYLQPVVTIQSFHPDEEVIGEGGKKEYCRILRFVGKRTPMILTRRQGKNLERVHGEDPNKWVGKQITLWAEERKVRGEMTRVLAIKAPSARSEELREQLAKPEPIETFEAAEREPGSDDE